MKQETLEEVLERLSITDTKKLSIFLEGMRYQKERSYSEEDMKLAFIEGRESSWTFEQWFEQFKKK